MKYPNPPGKTTTRGPDTGTSDAFYEPRIDPGANTIRPRRVNRVDLLSTQIPRGEDLTGMPKKTVAKRDYPTHPNKVVRNYGPTR